MFDLRVYSKRLVAALLLALSFSFFSGRASAATPPLCSDITATPSDLGSGGSAILVMGGQDGKAYYQMRPWLAPATSWVALFGGQALFPPCTTFAVATTGSNVDVFGIGSNGLMFTAYMSGGAWSWGSMNNGTFIPGAAVAAVERNIGRRQIDVFAIGTDGRVWTTWWNNGWSAWGPIGTQTFTQTNPILALPHGTSAHSDNLSQLDLYIVGSNNQVFTTYYDWYSPGWHNWGALASVGLTGGRISATARIYDIGNWASHNYAVQLDLFGVDQSHTARTTWWNNGWYNGGWGSFSGITMASGTGIAAAVTLPPSSSNTTVENLLLYTVDSSGFLRSTNWQPNQGWSSWSFFPNNTRVTNPINNSVKLFAGEVYVYNGNKLSIAIPATGQLLSLVN